MAAAQALAIVSQIQQLADGPEMPEMRQCLGQVVSSLQFFLEHPDSRVRLNAARTLAKLGRKFPAEVGRMDLSKVRTTLDRLKNCQKDGTANADAEELVELLSQLLGESSPEAAEKARPSPAEDGGVASGSAAESAPPEPAIHGGAGGEVVLNVGEGADPAVKMLILEKVVKMLGVVSVTFEGAHHVVINTRTAELAADAGFLGELLSTVSAKGLKGATLVRTTAAATDAASSNDAGGAAAENSQNVAGDEAALAPAYLDDDEGCTPAYLDDDEDEIHTGVGGGPASHGYGGASGMSGIGASSLSSGAAGAGLGPGGPGVPGQWSFFSQSNWMTSRRMQEFAGDDPTIAARLAKAKQREQERKLEETSRLSRLTGWLSGR